jgi:PKD repeat protein
MGFSLNNRQYNYFSDNSTNTADVYTMSNAVHFLVGSYTRGTNGNGSGTVSCWINPSISPTPGTPDLTVVSYQEDEDYDTIEIGCGGSGSWPGDWQFDELKVGTEWSDVVNADLPADTPPSALFTADPVTGTVPVSVTFTDLSGGTITNRLWDFGDGSSTNTDQLVFDHVYSTAGTYTVSLSLQGPQGTDSITMTNLISTEDPVAPTASFSADPLSGAVPVTVTFTDSSTGTITNRYWDFGDGATTNVTTAGVSYTYTNEGTYTVSLTVSGPVGTDTDTQVDLIEATGLGGGASIQMDADANDKGYRDDGSTIWVGQTEARVGTETAGTVTGLIIPFWVPALEGNSISDAELEVTYTQDTASFTAEANADVYAVRSDAASSVTVADDMTNTTATLVIDDYFEIGPGPLAGDKVTASSATLATWLDGEVGTVGEKWVFLRIIPDAVHSSGYKYARIATANTGTYPGAVLTITLGGGSGGPTNAPATFVISAAGALGSGSDVLNWTTEAGYIYSVWYSTNLLDGFQPLETNLDETVTSLTNNITTSPVFYKIEANW